MRTIDIKKFEENNINGKYQYEEGDSIYTIETGRIPYYFETVQTKGTTLEKKYIYSKDGKLTNSGASYCGVGTGISRIYNEYGNLVFEEDKDAPYKFTMEDLRKLIKKMYDIDILYKDRNQTGKLRLSREYVPKNSSRKPTYTVFVPTKSNYEGESLKIDGVTGVILKHKDDNGNELVTEDSIRLQNDSIKSNNNNYDKRNWTPLLD